MSKQLDRRQFLATTGTAAGAAVSAVSAVSMFHIVPSHVLGGQGVTPPSEKLRIASIGAGGRANASINAVADAGEQIVALADVDARSAAQSYEKFPDAKRFVDFREMLDKMDDDIDAVIVATPDHTHAVAVLDALARGKHVYCEKPLAHSVAEVRAMTNAARKAGVVTQLGNQGHSSEHIRLFCEWIWDGAIGNVTEIHASCDAFRHVYSQIDNVSKISEPHAVPDELNWDLWLGPAQYRPFNPMYLPFNWRGWMPYGTGCIGDWFCHVIDPSMWALDLGSPTTVVAEIDNDYRLSKHGETYPGATRITFEFPAKGKRGPVKLIWFDGANRIPRPYFLEPERNIPGTGAVVHGDKGAIMHGSHGAGGCRIIPESAMRAYDRPEPSIPRVKGHQQDWLDAIRAGKPASSNFDYGGPLTEIALLGAIATRFPTQKLNWDTKAARFTNFNDANAYLNPPYRDGWTLEG